MEPYRQQIEDLLIDELQGTLTEDGRRELDALMQTYPEADAIKADVYAAFSTEAGQRALHVSEQPADWVFDYGRRKKKRGILRFVSVAAASAAILCFAWFRIAPPPDVSTTPASAPVAAADAKHIRLTLATGQTVDLSNSGPQVQLNHLTVHNQQQTLSFSDVPTEAQWATLTVPVGKDYKVNLPDGSEVWLNSATTIHFPLRFSSSAREVDINGEAYVKVAPDASKPFIVHLPHSTVNVLGTSFNVNTYDSGQTRLALVEGAVNVVLPSAKTISVKPGFQLTAAAVGESQVRFDPKVVLGWRQGIYIYQNASLQELGRILNRWFGVDVVLDNDVVTAMKFNGVIRRDDDLEEYLRNLEYTNGPAFYIKDKVVHFK